jgi:hypothetical protein
MISIDPILTCISRGGGAMGLRLLRRGKRTGGRDRRRYQLALRAL